MHNYGRYSFLRHPFRVNVAPEVMKKRNTELFGDIPGVHVVFHDIIVAGKGESEHDDAHRAHSRLCQRTKHWSVHESIASTLLKTKYSIMSQRLNVSVT